MRALNRMRTNRKNVTRDLLGDGGVPINPDQQNQREAELFWSSKAALPGMAE